jgi:hypothetical protein
LFARASLASRGLGVSGVTRSRASWDLGRHRGAKTILVLCTGRPSMSREQM